MWILLGDILHYQKLAINNCYWNIWKIWANKHCTYKINVTRPQFWIAFIFNIKSTAHIQDKGFFWTELNQSNGNWVLLRKSFRVSLSVAWKKLLHSWLFGFLPSSFQKTIRHIRIWNVNGREIPSSSINRLIVGKRAPVVKTQVNQQYGSKSCIALQNWIQNYILNFIVSFINLFLPAHIIEDGNHCYFRMITLIYICIFIW